MAAVTFAPAGAMTPSAEFLLVLTEFNAYTISHWAVILYEILETSFGEQYKITMSVRFCL